MRYGMMVQHEVYGENVRRDFFFKEGLWNPLKRFWWDGDNGYMLDDEDEGVTDFGWCALCFVRNEEGHG